MAKSNNTNFVTIELPNDWSVEKDGHTFRATDLTPANAVYLLANGFKQSIGDAGAVTKADKRLVDMTMADLQKELRAKRFDAILNGTVSAGGPTGPRVVGIDRVIREIATKAVRNGLAKAKMPMPTPEKFKELIDKNVAKNGDKYRAEAERQMAEVAALPEADIDLD